MATIRSRTPANCQYPKYNQYRRRRRVRTSMHAQVFVKLGPNAIATASHDRLHEDPWLCNARPIQKLTTALNTILFKQTLRVPVTSSCSNQRRRRVKRRLSVGPKPTTQHDRNTPHMRTTSMTCRTSPLRRSPPRQTDQHCHRIATCTT